MNADTNRFFTNLLNPAKASPKDLDALLDAAHAAGMAAADGTTPPTMVVSEHASPFDDKSPVLKSWVVPEGPCGFAWVTVRPANSRLAKRLAAKFGARPAHGGGMMMWVSAFGQSMARKEAFAHAFTKTLRDAGFDRVSSDSRMD